MVTVTSGSVVDEEDVVDGGTMVDSTTAALEGTDVTTVLKVVVAVTSSG